MTPEEYKTYLVSQINNSLVFPDGIPVQETIGKSIGLMCPQLPYARDHNAIPLLKGYATKGCPVDCGPYWSLDHIKLMLKRGPHRSAM